MRGLSEASDGRKIQGICGEHERFVGDVTHIVKYCGGCSVHGSLCALEYDGPQVVLILIVSTVEDAETVSSVGNGLGVLGAAALQT